MQAAAPSSGNKRKRSFILPRKLVCIGIFTGRVYAQAGTTGTIGWFYLLLRRGSFAFARSHVRPTTATSRLFEIESSFRVVKGLQYIWRGHVHTPVYTRTRTLYALQKRRRGGQVTHSTKWTLSKSNAVAALL